MAGPHNKLATVEDPMCVSIRKAMFCWVGLARSNWVPLLEMLNNLLKLIIEGELYLASA